MLGKLSVAGLVLLLPLAGNAAEIKQRPFGFSDKVVRAQESDAFVVCSYCPDDHLSILPAPPKLAVRLGMGEPKTVQTVVSAESESEQKSNPEAGCVSCLMGTIHFPFDSAEITEKERSRLDEHIRGIPVGVVANLDGYTCALGSEFHNMDLSLRRAREVATYLKEKGIFVGKVEGLGKCCPVSEDRRLNRRVEIRMQQKEEK